MKFWRTGHSRNFQENKAFKKKTGRTGHSINSLKTLFFEKQVRKSGAFERFRKIGNSGNGTWGNWEEAKDSEEHDFGKKNRTTSVVIFRLRPPHNGFDKLHCGAVSGVC